VPTRQIATCPGPKLLVFKNIQVETEEALAYGATTNQRDQLSIVVTTTMDRCTPMRCEPCCGLWIQLQLFKP